MFSLSWLSNSPADTDRFAKGLARVIGNYLAEKHNLLIGLDGNLGAGKTTLASSLCQKLGVKADSISSPTFSIQNLYKGRFEDCSLSISHFDFYRIEDVDELIELGFEESIENSGLFLVEWSSRFPEVIPEESVSIEIESLSLDKRRITVKWQSEKWIGELRRELDSTE